MMILFIVPMGQVAQAAYPDGQRESFQTYQLGLAGGANIAIVASASANVSDALFTDVSSKLLATGQFSSVDIIHAGLVTPTLPTLQLYDAVLVWSNLDFLDEVALGNNLADYVDSGGGVVLAVFANTSSIAGRYVAGRWETDGYEVIVPKLENTAGPAGLGGISVPSHVLVNNVATFDGGLLSARPSTLQLASGSVIVAQWDDGAPLIAYREDLPGRRVDLGFYPPSSDVSSLYWDATTDGDHMLANAMVWAAGQSFTDVALQLIPFASPNIIDVSDQPGTLADRICDSSNVPATFVLELWVSDLGVLNTGVTGMYVDLSFNASIFQASTLVHTTGFPELNEGSIDNGSGLITNFGGSNFTPQGVDPAWVRLGYVEMTTLSTTATSITSALGIGGVGVFSRQPPTLSELSLGSTSFNCNDLLLPPLPAPVPHDVTKDRYLSLNPSTNPGQPIALRVTRMDSTTPWYVGCGLQDAGVEGKLSVLVQTTEYCVWTDSVIHVRGCEIVPGNEYLIEVTADDVNFSTPLSIFTTPPPFTAGRQFGDLAGSFIGGTWLAPDGLVTANDIVSVVQKFQLLPSAPHLSRVDTDGLVPNGIIAGNDILREVIAFAGGEFGDGVTNCLTGSCLPSCP